MTVDQVTRDTDRSVWSYRRWELDEHQISSHDPRRDTRDTILTPNRNSTTHLGFLYGTNKNNRQRSQVCRLLLPNNCFHPFHGLRRFSSLSPAPLQTCLTPTPSQTPCRFSLQLETPPGPKAGSSAGVLARSMRFPVRATEDTWPGRDLVLAGSRDRTALLLPHLVPNLSFRPALLSLAAHLPPTHTALASPPHFLS